ncbi:hypothetical protein [uncultured Arcticibacterium sp.]|uniref:hypothetical protein n=1 Tax=uncultured Arcticibacterium sp. TaxID=2173042 RepID=UPI0030F5523B
MKKNQKMDTELIFIIVSVLITGGLAINAHISNTKKDADLKNKTEEIIRLQNKLNKNSEDLIYAQNELLNYTTGKDAYGLVEILKISNNENGFYYQFYFSNETNYPLYDVKITLLNRNLIDQESLKKRNGLATLEDLKNYKNFNIGTIGGEGGGTSFGEMFSLKPDNLQDFLFSITSRNLSFSQQLKFIEKESVLLQATKLNSIVSKSNSKVKILVDKADDEFPGSIKGKVEWK